MDGRSSASRGRQEAPPGQPSSAPRREVDHAPFHATRVGEASHPGPPGIFDTVQDERKNADELAATVLEKTTVTEADVTE
eukprot:12925175-Prorocentrum_lima.AAC.1